MRRRRIAARVLTVVGCTLIALALSCVGWYFYEGFQVSAPTASASEDFMSAEALCQVEGSPYDAREYEEVHGVDWTGENGGGWESRGVCVWLSIPQTSIDQPVMQAAKVDPDYWLHHDIYGNFNSHGSCYIDADCERGVDSKNLVILGHNMLDGTMFHELARYFNRDFADAHPYIYVQVKDETRVYEVQAAKVIDGTEKVKVTEFPDEASFKTYWKSCLETSQMKRYEELDTDVDSMITLCTCSYFFNPSNERILVYGKRIA